ncbi:hypothetical protein K439DRAFT_1529775 [Ramaria rubella]|nr:hypothetical protein K439DRAFT_1529775 [Ramaria rubella]
MSQNWPKIVLRAFGTISPGDSESAWYLPWQAVLGALFPFNDDYLVLEDYEPEAFTLTEGGQLGAIDLTVTYIIEMFNIPIFFVDVKVPDDVEHNITHLNVDAQMQGRCQLFGEIFHGLLFPHIYSISAMGTRMAVYKYHLKDGTVDPPVSVIEAKYFCSDPTPRIRWSYNVLSDEGEQKLRELAMEMKALVKKLLPPLNTESSTLNAIKTQQMVQEIVDGIVSPMQGPNSAFLDNSEQSTSMSRA